MGITLYGFLASLVVTIGSFLYLLLGKPTTIPVEAILLGGCSLASTLIIGSRQFRRWYYG